MSPKRNRVFELAPTDGELIRLLQDNARQSSRVLAKQLNLSSSTVRRRLSELIAKGVARIVAVVDPETVGLSLIVFLGLNVDHACLGSAMTTLLARLEIQLLTTATGRFDIIALARFRSTKELAAFLEKELAQISGVRESETFICLQTAKGFWMQI